MTKTSRITPERLREVLSYDPITGMFMWKKAAPNARQGSIAGTRNDGYVKIKIDKTLYGAHRLAWLYVHGKLPAKYIDHINGVRDDNRLINLREATKSQNGMNQRRRNDNSTGYKGVEYRNSQGRYRAYIYRNKKQVNLGLFDTAELAHQAYCMAAKEMYGEFANNGIHGDASS